MLSRDCDACGERCRCSQRFRFVGVGEKVFCPNGTPHLVDSASLECVH